MSQADPQYIQNISKTRAPKYSEQKLTKETNQINELSQAPMGPPEKQYLSRISKLNKNIKLNIKQHQSPNLRLTNYFSGKPNYTVAKAIHTNAAKSRSCNLSKQNKHSIQASKSLPDQDNYPGESPFVTIWFKTWDKKGDGTQMWEVIEYFLKNWKPRTSETHQQNTVREEKRRKRFRQCCFYRVPELDMFRRAESEIGSVPPSSYLKKREKQGQPRVRHSIYSSAFTQMWTWVTSYS